VRFIVFNASRVGVLVGSSVWDVTRLQPGWSPEAAPYLVNEFIGAFDERRAAIEQIVATETPISLDSVRLAPVVPCPPTFFAAPLNYQAHKAEMKGSVMGSGGTSVVELGFFLKAPGCVTGPADPIELPRLDGRRFDYEGEIAFIIGRPGRAIRREDALRHIFGYTLSVDATLRMTETQREERSYRKSLYSFGPLGPSILTADEVPDPAALSIETWVNGELRQSGSLAELILDVPGLIEQASAILPLRSGDVYSTGSPAGVGPLAPGDVIEVRSPQLGSLRLPVVERSW
jgi:2-keto-4-pentenoate hydratase/2-oxohepta-3-ene-1,7-dioic acid hydratase in catechol pathway